jgi:predicted neuraminidase
MVRSSSDDGKTWSDARRLPDGILGPVKNKPIELADGTIVSGSSTEGIKEPPSWRVHIERSTDGGQTWTRTDVAPGPDAPAAIQPGLLQLGEGRLQAVGRTRSGKLFTTTSTDDGKSWSPLALTSLPNPNSGIDAVTLHDGRHLLIYNHTPKGRSPLNVSVSRDGVEWQTALVLENSPGEFSYPAIIQTADSLVHATYTWKRQRVKHVVIDPAKLQPRALVNGEWPK